MTTTPGTSSTTSISVDTALLEGWGNELRGCVEPLKALSRAGTKWTVVQPSGDCGVDGALGAFVDAWGHVADSVVDDLTRLADAVTTAAQMFAATDNAIAAQYRQVVS